MTDAPASQAQAEAVQPVTQKADEMPGIKVCGFFPSSTLSLFPIALPRFTAKHSKILILLLHPDFRRQSRLFCHQRRPPQVLQCR